MPTTTPLCWNHPNRSLSTKHEARKSLRTFKSSSAYRNFLRDAIQTAQREARSAPTDRERRRARLDLIEAENELGLLASGERLDEFTGLIQLPDPLREGR